MQLRKALPLSAALISTLAYAPLHAQLYWDTNGATAGAGTAGVANGTWDTGTTANWTTDSSGSSATTTYTAASDVVFSAGTDVTTAAITASGTPSAHSITIEEGAYSFSGNISLSSGDNSGSLNVASGASATFAGNMSLVGNTAFAIEGSLTTNIIGAGKTLTKTGAGTLTLTDAGSSDYTVNADGGLVILQRSTTKQLKVSSIGNGGTVRLAASEQYAGQLTVNTGGTLQIDAGISDNLTTLQGGGDIVGGASSALGVTGGTFSGTVSGDVSFTKTGSGTHTFSGTSTSTGDITVSAGTYTLSSTGELTFTIGADGVNNAILGAGIANLNGAFNFDLDGADLTDGNSWLIVDVNNLTETFAGTFVVNGFIETDNVWTNGLGFSFDELTGVLSYSGGVIPEPSTFALLGGLGALGFAANRRRRAAL